MRFDVISLFPEMIIAAASTGVTGRAIERGIVELALHNPRDYAYDKHKTVDDRPYGGGAGMVMKYQPLHDALLVAKQTGKNSKVVYLSPQGAPLSQALIAQATQLEQLILVAGRYEGIDERFIRLDCDAEWSLGDYVISGGELAALVVIDAVTRLLPNVLGDAQSAAQDSHSDGLLDYPHYTRPERVESYDVPAVLLSGNHSAIERWRLTQSLGRTWQKRPDLLAKKILTAQQQQLLEQFKIEQKRQT